jgi:flagellar biosynthesis/type III secretory pathway protein FliH
MTRFKLMGFMVLMGVAAIIVCGVGVFYSHRTGHGTTVEERTAYDIGEKAGEEAMPGATLPTEAELNTTAQKYYEQQGSAEELQNPTREDDLQAFKHAFEKGYSAGFKKTHPQH